jgi:hypothetical protein
MELVNHASDLSALDMSYLRRLAMFMIGCFVGWAVILFVANILSHVAA